MDNDDTQRTEVERGRHGLSPAEIFDKAIVDHQRATDAICVAISARDPRAAAVAATDAFAHWITAGAAMRRLALAEGADLGQLETLRYVLQAHRKALVAAFRRARTKLTAPILDDALDQLKTSMDIAESHWARRRIQDARSSLPD